MNDCVFCKIVKGEIKTDDVFFEDDKVLVMLDLDWATKGHTLVIWKEHADNISDLSEEQFLHFSRIVRKIEKALLDILQVDKSVVLKSGGIVSHFHFHIYPIKRETSWDTVKDMFDKKIKHEATDKEKGGLIASLKTLLV